MQIETIVTEKVTYNETDNAIIDMISDILGVARERVDYNADFEKDLGADSLDMVELVMEFEELFDCEVLDEDALKMEKVKHVLIYADEKGLSIKR